MCTVSILNNWLCFACLFVYLAEFLAVMEKGDEFRLTVEDDAKWLEWAQRQFAAIAGNDRLIDWQEFKLALKVK